MDNKRVAADAFSTMWSFLQMGGQKADYPALKKSCLQLRDMMMQKTGGQEKYRRPGDIPFEDIDALKNEIVIEALALVLSGEFGQAGKEAAKNEVQG